MCLTFGVHIIVAWIFFLWEILNKFKQEKAWCVLSRIMPKTPNGSAVRDGAVFKFWCGFGCGMPDLPIIKRTMRGHVTCAGRSEKIMNFFTAAIDKEPIIV